jgi:hypothetical protein
MNGGKINSITGLHLVGYFYWATYVFKICGEISMRSYVLLKVTDSFTVSINEGFHITGQSSISFYINPCLDFYVILGLLYNFYEFQLIHDTSRQQPGWILPDTRCCNTLVVICVILVVIFVVRLLFVLFCVLFVCKFVLPQGDKPIAVNKYIYISIQYSAPDDGQKYSPKHVELTKK